MRLRTLGMLSAAAVLSGCVPSFASVTYDVSDPALAFLTVTVSADLEGSLASRPRSEEDLRDASGMLAEASARAAADPGLCSGLSGSGQVSASSTAGSVSCSVSFPRPAGSSFSPDLEAPVAAAWVMRLTLGEKLAEVLSEGYEGVPTFAYAPLSPEMALHRDACAEGDGDACAEMYGASEDGSADEVFALLRLRPDVVGDVPSWFGLVDGLDVEVTVMHPGVVAGHNGSSSGDGSVSWSFTSSSPGEARRGLQLSWEEVAAPDVPSSGSSVRSAAGVALLVAAALLTAMALRPLLRSAVRGLTAPSARKVKQRSLSRPRRR